MRGYFNMPEQTARHHGEGLAATEARASTSRACCVVGRLKDMIIRGGENIYPAEIEAVLVTHPGVADATVIGVPDAFWGREGGRLVRVDRRAPREDRRACVERLARFKRPRHFVFVADFPKTASGKVRSSCCWRTSCATSHEDASGRNRPDR
jgi:fatty-acyl-CoA synthase